MEMQEKVQNLLTEKFPNAEIKLSGDGCHFTLDLVSDQFEGKSRLQRSRLVYAVLGEMINNGDLHALQMNLKTNAEI